MKTPLFLGCATALVTPFTENGVDERALRTLVDFQIENGVRALVACGTTGEPAAMTDKEWALTLKTVVDQAGGRVPVIAGTGGNNTARVIEAAREARSLGADAQLCVTPYYNKTTQEGLFQHYAAISEKTDLPIIVYHVPGRTNLWIAPETLGRISRLPGVTACKEASGDLTRYEDMRNAADLAFYSGSDEVTVPMMCMGASGVISVISNIMPRETARMCAYALNGDFTQASQLQLRLLPLIHLLFCETSPIPVKTALGLMNICENRLRLPLVPMSAANQERLRIEMERQGIL